MLTHISRRRTFRIHTYIHTYIFYLCTYKCVSVWLCVYLSEYIRKKFTKNCITGWLTDWLPALKVCFFFAKVHTHTPITDGTSRMPAIQMVRHTRSCQYNWLNWVQMSVGLPVCMSDWRSDDWQAGLSQCLRHFQHIQYLLPELLGAQTHTHRQNSEQKYGMRKETEKQQIFHSFSINIPCKYACWRWWRNHVNV